MCATLIGPSLRGTERRNAAVIDHIRPYKLRPDLAFDESNLALICKRCHDSICHAIEQRHWPDDAAIAREKAAHRPVGLDGYPIAQN